jgi:hypothetical protein
MPSDVYMQACVARGWDARLCEAGAHLVDLGDGWWRLEARAIVETDPEWVENPPGTRLASYDVFGCPTEADALVALGVVFVEIPPDDMEPV